MHPNPSQTHITPAGWSSPVARQAHNLKVTGSNPVPAPKHLPKSTIRSPEMERRTRWREPQTPAWPRGHRVGQRTACRLPASARSRSPANAPPRPPRRALWQSRRRATFTLCGPPPHPAPSPPSCSLRWWRCSWSSPSCSSCGYGAGWSRRELRLRGRSQRRVCPAGPSPSNPIWPVFRRAAEQHPTGEGLAGARGRVRFPGRHAGAGVYILLLTQEAGASANDGQTARPGMVVLRALTATAIRLSDDPLAQPVPRPDTSDIVRVCWVASLTSAAWLARVGCSLTFRTSMTSITRHRCRPSIWARRRRRFTPRRIGERL